MWEVRLVWWCMVEDSAAGDVMAVDDTGTMGDVQDSISCHVLCHKVVYCVIASVVARFMVVLVGGEFNQERVDGL